MLALAKTLVAKVPAPSHPSLIALPHLTSAVARSLSAEDLRGISRPTEEQILALLTGWIEESTRPPSLGELTRQLRALRDELRHRVYGQDHAIQQFIDGLFNTEVVAVADTERRKPAGLFVFAGPPSVGKTFLAELAASSLTCPFKRFDMSAYAHGHEAASLTGIPRFYQGAQPGTLTDSSLGPHAIQLGCTVNICVLTSGVMPILICKQASELRRIDQDIAAADAKQWWETGRVPLRPTPLAQK